MSQAIVRAQSDAKEDVAVAETASHRWLHEYYLQQAKTYEFFHDENRSMQMKLVDKPVFRWKQDDDWSGDLFLWTHLGRPEVVGCILASKTEEGTRSVAHEFHSLATEGLPRTKMVGDGIWQPTAGLTMTPFPDSETPAKSASLRMSQMRALARGFNAVMKHEEKDWELRWLPQPLFRYESTEAKVIDGGLFAYVWTRGTDPELLMLLECRDEKPAPRWYYAPITFTSRPIRLTLHDREVWTSKGGGGWVTGESKKPYETFFGGRVTVPTDKK